jgi:hypothetical protein
VDKVLEKKKEIIVYKNVLKEILGSKNRHDIKATKYGRDMNKSRLL